MIGDLIVTGGIVGFVIALIPGIVENHRLKRGWTLWSCALTAVMAYVVTIGLHLLGATISEYAELSIAVLWSILAVQSWKWKR